MSYIEVNTTWTQVGDGGGGSMATGTGTAFNTDTKQIEDWNGSRSLSILDPRPPDVHLVVGTLLYWECSDDYTATKWIYAGGRSTRIEIEAQSVAYCGYTPPLTCNLGTATVQQTFTVAGATLTYQFTGTANGQAWYSLDGGAEQTSPRFRGVAAGAHQLVLRDAGLDGCTRTVDVEVVIPDTLPPPGPPEAPEGASVGVDFVGQPLWFVPASGPAGARVEIELYAESAHGADDFSLVLTLRQLADAAGRTRFRLDTLLWPLLGAFVPPVAAQTTRRSISNLVNYFVRTATYVPGQPVAYALSALRTAARGGLPAEWAQGNYFAWRAGDSFEVSPFLSWQSAGPGAYAAGLAKDITPQQPEWLCWLSPTNPEVLRIVRTYDMGPGTDAVVDYEYLREPPARGWQNQLLAIPLAVSRFGYARLRLQVQAEDGRSLSPVAVYRFVAETPRTRYLLFTNSLGGVDTVRGEGRLEVALEASTDKSERPARFGDAPAMADRQVSDLVASRKFKLALGWQEPEELAWLQELVLTRELWQQVAGQLRPLDWPKRTLGTYADEPGLRGLLLEFDYAFAPTAYAPGTY